MNSFILESIILFEESMNQTQNDYIVDAPIILVVALSYQFLSSSNIDNLKSNGTTSSKEQ